LDAQGRVAAICGDCDLQIIQVEIYATGPTLKAIRLSPLEIHSGSHSPLHDLQHCYGLDISNKRVNTVRIAATDGSMILIGMVDSHPSKQGSIM